MVSQEKTVKPPPLQSLKGGRKIVQTLFDLLVANKKGWFDGKNGRFCFDRSLLTSESDKTLFMSKDLIDKLTEYLNAIWLNEVVPNYRPALESLNKLAKNAANCEYYELSANSNFSSFWFEPLSTDKKASRDVYIYQHFDNVFDSLSKLVEYSGMESGCLGIIKGTLMAHQLVDTRVAMERFFKFATLHYPNLSWKIIIQDPKSEIAEHFAMFDFSVKKLKELEEGLNELKIKVNRKNGIQNKKGRIAIVKEPHLIATGRQGVFFFGGSSIIDSAASPIFSEDEKMDWCAIKALPFLSQRHIESLHKRV